MAITKRLLASRKGGHTGTLDPFATGLLPLAFGEATKFSRFLLDADKGYLATLVLGQTSSTGDIEGSLSPKLDIDVDADRIAEVTASFVGEQDQIPPMYSALHYEGRRLYELAREGVEVPRAPRRVTIHTLEVGEIVGEKVTISVKCSKGTYIRTLAEDIGKRLGLGAYLCALRRTHVGDLHLSDAVTLEHLEQADPTARSLRLMPPERFVERLPRVSLDAAGAAAFCHGQRVNQTGAEGEVTVFREAGDFLGVGRRDGAGGLFAVRLMAGTPKADSPDFA
ncbi:tRNA pseudouridine(55) synthase TruB [Usitatibacter palustris]|uniref:tRNA pseudouridine(55) synthase TruB n=1 Tax=Usitatibacter palustris TaxID=2732487 RepID=UPI001FE78174